MKATATLIHWPDCTAVGPSYGSFVCRFQGINFRGFETFCRAGRVRSHREERAPARVSNHEAVRCVMMAQPGMPSRLASDCAFAHPVRIRTSNGPFLKPQLRDLAAHQREVCNEYPAL